MEHQKNDRMLEIFFRSLKGEHISPKKLAEEYQVSVKSIHRDIAGIQQFLTEHRELMQNAELSYSYRDRCYVLSNDEFLRNKELFAVVKVLLGCRCFSKDELLSLLAKLKKFTTIEDRASLEGLIRREVYHYHEVKADCPSVIDNLWKLIQAIENKRVLTVHYYKMNRTEIRRRLKPAALMFSEYYFYLIAYEAEGAAQRAKYFRVDRIASIVENREHFVLGREQDFDEGSLREQNQFMFPGETVRIRFAFSGPSVQAVLDRLPTARIIEKDGSTCIMEAEVNNGRGLLMYLLSQGSWVKVLEPQSLADEMQAEIRSMQRMYQDT